MLQFIKDRLKEPSTKRGAILLAGVVGIIVSPDQIESILVLIAAAFGVFESFRKES